MLIREIQALGRLKQYIITGPADAVTYLLRSDAPDDDGFSAGLLNLSATRVKDVDIPSDYYRWSFGILNWPISADDFSHVAFDVFGSADTASALTAGAVAGSLKITAMLEGDLPVDPTGMTWNTKPTIPPANYTMEYPLSCQANGADVGGGMHEVDRFTFIWSSVLDVAAAMALGPNAGKKIAGFAMWGDLTSSDGTLHLNMSNVRYIGGTAKRVVISKRSSTAVAGPAVEQKLYMGLDDYNFILSRIARAQLLNSLRGAFDRGYGKNLGARYDQAFTGGFIPLFPFTDGDGQGVKWTSGDTSIPDEAVTASSGVLLLQR